MHPNLISLMLFCFVTSCTPGPNNILASYYSLNFGIKKTFPHMMGVALGYTSMITILDIGLILPFKKYPIIQDVLKVLGSFFLIYLAYKISFSKSSSGNLINNPVKFLESYFFQFINPKGVSVAIITIVTFVDSTNYYLMHSLWIIGISFFFACFSISFWSLLGKFLRRFATNEKFIKRFNYVMSLLLVSCIATFYL